MKSIVSGIVEKIRRLEAELETELARRRLELAFAAPGSKPRFEERILKRHRKIRTRLSHYILGARPLLVLTAPIIYAVVIPLFLLDVLLTVYQALCFPIYGIPAVRRGDYLIFDRHQLAYLNAIEKLNCAYCSYANGLIAYVREIASRTEQYWCPIKHAQRIIAAHEHYWKFADYGDAGSYHAELEALRKELRQTPEP